MSESEAYEEVTVTSEGVSVTKRYEADEFPVPAIAFNFESDRSEPVTVHLSDVVPEDVAVDDLGFHPEYGSEYWDIEDDEISFERDIEPGAEYTTVYGIRATGTDNVEQFLTEPTLESVEPTQEEADDSSLVGEGDDAVKDVISGDADSVPGLDDEEEDLDTLDLKDPNNEGEAAAASASDDGDDGDSDAEEETPEATTNGEASAVEISGDTLITALANELREQEVSKDDVKLLRKAFDLAADDSGSVTARVSKLQQDVSDVIAYTDALEEFLDENGTAEEMIGDFRSDLEDFESDVDDFQSRLESLEGDVVTDDELAALEGDIGAVEDEISDLSSSMESVEATVANVEDDVDSVEDTVGEVEGTVDDLDSELDDLQTELDDIREDVGSGDTEERVEEIEDEIVELKKWRKQLSSVIGGAE